VVVVNHIPRVFLLRSLTIAKYKIEMTTATIRLVILKSCKIVKGSFRFNVLGSKLKFSFLCFIILANHVRKPEGKQWLTHCFHPLTNSFVEQLTNSLQLHNLIFAIAEIGDEHEALGIGDSTAEFLRPIGYKYEWLGIYVHFIKRNFI